MYREGSIGLPFPDTYYKIVKPGTTDEAPYGEDGEICLCGPSVMIEYVNQPKRPPTCAQEACRTAICAAAHRRSRRNGRDGFLFFKTAQSKRMIITSGLQRVSFAD
jgi:long-chain acyl-CoA synthetase